jgi:hypothetical protein
MTRGPVPKLRAVARRTLGALTAATLIAACTPAAPQSHVPSGSSAATASATAVPSASIGAPSASPSGSTSFEYSDILRVEVKGLAVRAAPMRSSPLVQGNRFDGTSVVPVGEIRLNIGDFVSVQLGPLPIGDTVWYLAWPAQDARLHYSLVTWINGPGWVAASVGKDQYLTLYRRPETSEVEEYMPVGLTVSGTGNYESKPQARSDLFAFGWAIALNDAPAPCPFSVSLVPAFGAEAVVAVETSTTGVTPGPAQGPDSQINATWPAGGTWDSYTVSIRSTCTGTVGLHVLGHD